MPVQKLKRSYRKTRYILYKETLVDWKEHFWSFLGSFVGIGILAYIQSIHFSGNDAVYLIGSFGASSVLIYGIIQSPFSQPRNLVGGHLISAFSRYHCSQNSSGYCLDCRSFGRFAFHCLYANH